MRIETCRVLTIDAAGEKHPKTLAWRICTPNVGGKGLAGC